MATFNGDTVLGILKQSLQYINNNSQLLDYNAPPYYASLLNTVSPLSCYCARVIREHGIPLNEGRLPFRLQEFVSRHCATEGHLKKKLIATSAVFVMFHCFLIFWQFATKTTFFQPMFTTWVVEFNLNITVCFISFVSSHHTDCSAKHAYLKLFLVSLFSVNKKDI